MPEAEPLAALLRRLADGPCRTLDADLGVAVGHLRRAGVPGQPSKLQWFRIGSRPGFPLHDRWYWNDSAAAIDQVPPYTALLDAALTLYRYRPERVPSDPCAACAEALRERAGSR
jgi:hypothetical protein